MSCFLFLLTVDWTMRRTTERHRNGIRWNITSMLEDLDFAVDVVLVTSKYEHIPSKINRLVDNAGRLGLKLNAQKCKVMRMNTRREEKVMTGREEGEDVEEFVYLGTTVTKEGGGTEDIKKRLSKARELEEDLEHTKHWSEYHNQTVSDLGTTSPIVWM